jgi:gamma-butyrobetaine dioxygenase
MSSESTLDEVEELLARAAQVTYGERVTMLEHSIQTALLARSAGARDALVAAALLHDIGTFVSAADGSYGEYAHDRSGGEWLARRFPPAVSEPVRLHVAAKRYLCATRPGYSDRLSPASVHTLAHQGGPMNEEEARAFEREAFFDDALRLREWDDQGKTPGMRVPTAASFRGLLHSLLA